jgi:hypothetical protein
MSSSLRNAVYDRLAGIEDLSAYAAQAAAQAALVALLGTTTLKGGATKRAVHHGTRSLTDAEYPAITYRFVAGSAAAQTLAGVIEGVAVALEVWSQVGPAQLATMDGYIEVLLDCRRGAPAFEWSDGGCFHMEAQSGILDGYDPERRAWYGLRMWRMIEERGA